MKAGKSADESVETMVELTVEWKAVQLALQLVASMVVAMAAYSVQQWVGMMVVVKAGYLAGPKAVTKVALTVG